MFVLVMWVNEDTCWVSNEPCRDAVMTSHFALPLAIASSLREAAGDAAIHFILHRDDGSAQPVYESNTPQLKIMTVFSEFAQAVHELCTQLGVEFMRLEPSGEPGGFKLHLAPELNTRALMLLRAGLEIITITRGFELVRFSHTT